MSKIACCVRGRAFVLVLAVIVMGCAPEGQWLGNLTDRASDEVLSEENIVRLGETERAIGDRKNRFNVHSSRNVKDKTAAKKLIDARSEEGKRILSDLAKGNQVLEVSVSEGEISTSPDSLKVGFPTSLLGKYQLFGAVITEVSDHKSEHLGGLKLTDLTPLHVKTEVASLGPDEFVLGLRGCPANCDENSEEIALIGFRIDAIDEQNQQIIIDLTETGRALDLIKIMDPEGNYTKLKSTGSKAVMVDYSKETLVFDIVSEMIPLDADPSDPNRPITTFKVRWYIQLGDKTNPNFVSRENVEGVGFFETARVRVPLIQRHSKVAKYYLKNVPEEHKGAFRAAFDSWNLHFKALTGEKIIEYEFVDADDPRAPLLVTGDIRHNILEWDLTNRAPYGGLGPSIANQHTGEIISSNVLIQGPHIVKIYKEWFEVDEAISELRSEGRDSEADFLLLQFKRKVEEDLSEKNMPRFELSLNSLGHRLDFRVVSQMPEYQDPIFRRMGFDPLPEGVTYEEYMRGYFHELVAHEVGHNVGLRHNFKGNLGAQKEAKEGKVSSTIMEYMGRSFRHLNRIGHYDLMAVRYGYLGESPQERDIFCTDEQVVAITNPHASPECSRDDATSDPFSYFEKRLQRAIDLLTARGQVTEPSWVISEMDTEFTSAVEGLGFYASTARTQGEKLSHFFGAPGRPLNKDGIKDYVFASIKRQVCDPGLEGIVQEKLTEEAQMKTRKNVEDLRAKTIELLEKLDGIEEKDLTCQL